MPLTPRDCDTPLPSAQLTPDAGSAPAVAISIPESTSPAITAPVAVHATPVAVATEVTAPASGSSLLVPAPPPGARPAGRRPSLLQSVDAVQRRMGRPQSINGSPLGPLTPTAADSPDTPASATASHSAAAAADHPMPVLSITTDATSAAPAARLTPARLLTPLPPAGAASGLGVGLTPNRYAITRCMVRSPIVGVCIVQL